VDRPSGRNDKDLSEEDAANNCEYVSEEVVIESTLFFHMYNKHYWFREKVIELPKWWNKYPADIDFE